MSVEKDVYAALVASETLAALVAGRIFPNRALDNTARPYITYTTVSAVPQNDLSSTPLVDNRRIQVDCWSDVSYAQAKDMAAACRVALKNLGLCVFERDDFEDGVRIHRVQLDFSIFG